MTPRTPPAEKPRGRGWPWMVVGILILPIGAHLYLVYRIAADPGLGIEPDYYRKAMAWDQKMDQDRSNERLGWKAGLEIGGEGTPMIRLTDRTGKPLEGATLEVEAFALADSDSFHHVKALPVEGGIYRVPIPIKVAGLWEFRTTATRGGDRFTAVSRLEIPIEREESP